MAAEWQHRRRFDCPRRPCYHPRPLAPRGFAFALADARTRRRFEGICLMGYKLKPSKGVAKRMKVTKTGKLKHRHEKNSHLRSARTSKTKRHLGRAGVLHEG